jgi:hypothetical protein
MTIFPRKPMSPEGRRRVVIFLLFLFAYTYFIHVGFSANPSSRYALIWSIVDDHVIYIDQYHAITIDKAFYAGHYYSDKAVGASLLGMPGYLLAKYAFHDPAVRNYMGAAFATWTAVSIPSAALALLFFVFLGRIVDDQRWRFLITLGCMAWAPSRIPIPSSSTATNSRRRCASWRSIWRSR